MKRYLSSRHPFTLTASAALLAAGLLTAPVLRAQTPSPAPSASPASSSSGSDDIFEVIKKGADKLQKEAKAQKDIAPQVKVLNERQNEMLRKHVELEHHLQSVLLKQQEAIQSLQKSVDTLEKQMAECGKSQSMGTPEAGKTLPMTEPAVKPTPAPSPTATPAPTPTPAQS